MQQYHAVCEGLGLFGQRKRTVKKPSNLAGETGLEPATFGFGDRNSTN